MSYLSIIIDGMLHTIWSLKAQWMFVLLPPALPAWRLHRIKQLRFFMPADTLCVSVSAGASFNGLDTHINGFPPNQ